MIAHMWSGLESISKAVKKPGRGLQIGVIAGVVLLVLMAVGVGAIAFVAGLQLGGGRSGETALVDAPSLQPTPSSSGRESLRR